LYVFAIFAHSKVALPTAEWLVAWPQQLTTSKTKCCFAGKGAEMDEERLVFVNLWHSSGRYVDIASRSRTTR
jgi:hypothetical protein